MTTRDRAAEDPVVKRAEELFQDSRAYRDDDLRMDQRWKSAREWYLNTGRNWDWNHSSTYVNLIASNSDGLVATLTDPRPEFRFRAPDPQGVPTAEYLNASVPPSWDDEKGSRKHRNGVKGSVVFGTSFKKITHEPSYGGSGVRVRIREVPCYRIFPAPYASCPESAPWMIEVTPKSVEEIERDYRVRIPPELEPDADFPDISEDLQDVGRGGASFRHTTVGDGGSGTSSTLFPATFLNGVGKPTGIVFQKELWINDSTEENRYWIEQEAGGLLSEVFHGRAPKFPKGRVISWANGYKLYDRPAPYRTPYVRYMDQGFPDFFWGLGEIPRLIKLQLLHDDIIDNMRLIHAYMAFPKTIVDDSTGLKDRELGNDPGEIWRTRPGTSDRIRVIPSVTPPGEFYTHADKIESWFDQMTGRTEVTRGLTPANVGSGRAIGLLQDAAETRVRARMRELEDSLEDEAMMIAERILEFGPPHARLPDPETGTFGDFYLRKEDRTRPFSVKVDIVAGIDALKQREFEQLLLFKQMGLITDERLVKDSGHSSSQAILAELPAVQRQRMLQTIAQGLAEPSPQEAAEEKTGAQRAVNKTLRPRQPG